MNDETPETAKVTHLPEERDRQWSALYRQLEAGDPSPALDREVLEAASQAALQAARGCAHKPAGRRRVPLPLAAAVLVASVLVPLLIWNAQLREPEVDPGTAEPSAQSDHGATALSRVESPPVPEALPMVPAPEADDPGAEALDGIRALLASGDDALAWRRFADFRRQFPEARLPDDLLDELAEARARLLEQAAAE